MPKLYLKYAQRASLGVIASNSSPVKFSADGKFAVTAALENVCVWDLRTGNLAATWEDIDNSAEVTCMERSANGEMFAVGYSDGTIRIWEFATATTSTTFSGHKTAVTALAFSFSGAQLASGSKDTDIVVWDVISETGLFRLRGHKDQVTGLKFIEAGDYGCNHLISVSKDTMVKFWDLGTQHCVETIIAHRGEVWGLALFPSEKTTEAEDLGIDKRVWTVVTGGSEGEIRVWKLDLKVLSEKLDAPSGMDLDETATDHAKALEDASAEKTTRRCLTYYGVLERQSKERVLTIIVHPGRRYIVVQGADRIAEVYKIRTQAELKKREARLKKRQKEKKSVEGQGLESSLLITDEYPRISAIRCGSKIRSFDISPVSKSGDNSPFQILCSLTSNALEVHTAGLESKEDPTRQDLVLDAAGHRNDIRTLALSSDDSLLISGSHSSIKLWNIESQKCLATMDSGYALCSAFVPGNNHCIVGTKTGELQIFHLGSHSLMENIQAHEGSLWSLQVWPDRRGITTGGADKDVKFWEFALIESDNSKRLTLTHVKTLKLNEDVLCVRHSHDGKLLAVSLLDCTVKVFYADTLKFFLSLYGHTLPVLSMDISSDGTLIATGSADKSIKIWGLDFGDCHRSLRAHDDSVMAVRWIFGTHYLVSAGKDRLVKWWDADKFEQIMKVNGHHGEVWALAVGKYGSIVVSGSHDRSIRIWEKTDEQFALEEERERELEEMYDQAALADDEMNKQAIGSGITTDADIDGLSKAVTNLRANTADAEVGNATLATAESMRAGEKISMALDVWDEEKEKQSLDAAALARWEVKLKSASGAEKKQLEKAKPVLEPRNPYIIATGFEGQLPEAYVLHVFEGIRSGDLEQALLVLTFARVTDLLKILLVWVEKNWNMQMVSRVLDHILRLHQNEIVTSRVCRPLLLQLKAHLPQNIRKDRDIIGMNLAALKFMRREWEANHSKDFMDALGIAGENHEDEKKVSSGKGKRKRVVVVSR